MRRFLLLSILTFSCAACANDEAVRVDDDSAVLQTDIITTAIPEGEVETPDHGKETGLSYGAVAGTEEMAANGVVTAHYFEDGATIVGVQVNIAVPEEGMFYEGWLINDIGERVSIGHLTNPLSDARHSTRFEHDEDLRSYEKIEVTLERDDGNPSPSTVVATGNLKETKR